MNTRHTLTAGPKSSKLLGKLVAKMRKESGTDYTPAMVLESAATIGLNKIASTAVPSAEAVTTLRD